MVHAVMHPLRLLWNILFFYPLVFLWRLPRMTSGEWLRMVPAQCGWLHAYRRYPHPNSGGQLPLWAAFVYWFYFSPMRLKEEAKRESRRALSAHLRRYR